MDQSTFPAALRDYWHPVARSEDVGDKPFAARLLDKRLVLYRSGDRVVAFEDLCIHRGTPLSLGWVEGEHLVCAYHGWAYGADGACVRIPSLPPEQGIPRKARATAFNAEERYGLVWVCLAEEPRLPVGQVSAPARFLPSRHRFTGTAALAAGTMRMGLEAPRPQPNRHYACASISFLARSSIPVGRPSSPGQIRQNFYGVEILRYVSPSCEQETRARNMFLTLVDVSI